jgi:hypothetical protein
MPLDNPSIGLEITSGSYVGDSTANRAILHGLPRTPRVVMITDGNLWFSIWPVDDRVRFIDANAPAAGGFSVTALDVTNFYVGNAAQYTRTANLNTTTYFWVAIG